MPESFHSVDRLDDSVAELNSLMLTYYLDDGVFDRMRHGRWWRAPLVATLLAAVLDTAVFWSIAFAGNSDPTAFCCSRRM